MGTTQSYLSPEALVTAAVVAGAVGFGYTQVASSGNTPTETTVGGGEGEGKKAKGKKKSNTVHTTPPPADDVKTPDNISVLPFPAVVPGQFDGGASDALAHSGTDALSSSSSQAKKGKKKKKAGKAGAQSQSESRQDTPVGDSVVSPAAAAALSDPDTVPVVASSTKPSTKSKKKKKQQASPQEFAKPLGSDVPSPAKVENSSQRLQQSTASIASFAMESDGEWTQVSRRADRIHTSSIAGGMSDVGQTTSNTTGSSSPVDTRTEEDDDQEEERPMSGPGEQNTLAKRLLPKPRKTGVEDMLATSDYPSYSRVMRVQSGDKPAAGFSWGDYEDAGGDNPGLELDADSAEPDEDEGWGVVKRGGRPKNRLASSQQSASSTSRIETAPETMTKRQRQNAARRDAEKSAKAAAEQERLATLARHKRELERAKMDAQFGKGGGKKATSGGMKAVIDEKGKLVWD